MENSLVKCVKTHVELQHIPIIGKTMQLYRIYLRSVGGLWFGHFVHFGWVPGFFWVLLIVWLSVLVFYSVLFVELGGHLWARSPEARGRRIYTISHIYNIIDLHYKKEPPTITKRTASTPFHSRSINPSPARLRRDHLSDVWQGENVGPRVAGFMELDENQLLSWEDFSFTIGFSWRKFSGLVVWGKGGFWGVMFFCKGGLGSFSLSCVRINLLELKNAKLVVQRGVFEVCRKRNKMYNDLTWIKLQCPVEYSQRWQVVWLTSNKMQVAMDNGTWRVNVDSDATSTLILNGGKTIFQLEDTDYKDNQKTSYNYKYITYLTTPKTTAVDRPLRFRSAKSIAAKLMNWQK